MILIGASGHAKVILDILEKSDQEVKGLVDANPDITALQRYPVFYDQEFQFSKEDDYLISIGSNIIRKKIANSHLLKYDWAIHPSVILGDDVTIGQGTVIMGNAIINSSTSIGNHCIINTSASIDHDNFLNDFVHVSPNATLCGAVTVGEGTHIGAGATIIPNIAIGKWATIGAGAVIIEDVPDGAIVVGNPGRIIKTKNV